MRDEASQNPHGLELLGVVGEFIEKSQTLDWRTNTALPSRWQVATPHKDIREGKLSEAIFAAAFERKQYAFRNQPNLNRVILGREETINEDRIQEELKAQVHKDAGRSLEVYLWPENPADVPDNKNFKIVILSPSFTYDSAKGKAIANEFYEKAGVGFRVYKNTLFILTLDYNQLVSLNKSLRRYLALTEIQKDKSLQDVLTKQSQEEIKKKFKEKEKEIPFKILTAYRYLAIFEKDGINWKDMGIPTIGSEQTINEKSFKEIYELHLKTPGMSLLETEKVLLDAVTEGVRTGILGLREGREVYFKDSVTPNLDSVALRGEVGEKIKEEKKKEECIEPVKPGIVSVVEPPTKKPKEKEGIIKSIALRTKVPWDKLSEVTKGVIAPLKDEGLPPEITIEVKANSEEGFKRHTLNSRVKETLLQIRGKKIEKWEKEE